MHVDRLSVGDSHPKPALGGRARLDRFLPALKIWKFLDVLALALPAQGPSNAGDVGDRIFAGQELAIGETVVHHAIEPVDLIRVALDRVVERLWLVVEEVVVIISSRDE